MNTEIVNVEAQVVDSSEAVIGENWDWTVITNEDDRGWAQIAAGEIGRHLKSAISGILRTGNTLIEAKSRLPHGQYTAWYKGACGLSDTYASSFVKAAKWLSTVNPDRVEDLQPIADVGIIFSLSSDTTTEEVRQWVIERCNAGDPPSRKEVKARKANSSSAGKHRTIAQEALSILKTREEARSLASKAAVVSTRELMDLLDVDELPKKVKVHSTDTHEFYKNPSGDGWVQFPKTATSVNQSTTEQIGVSALLGQAAEDANSKVHTIAEASSLMGFASAHALTNMLTPSAIKRHGFPEKNGYRAVRHKRPGYCVLTQI